MAEAEDDLSENEFLPDLPKDTCGEQLVLMQKVFRCNELFIKRHQEIKEWLLSPCESRKYPKHAMKNKYGYRKRAMKYTYDEKEQKLYRNVKCPDGIGKYNNIDYAKYGTYYMCAVMYMHL